MWNKILTPFSENIRLHSLSQLQKKTAWIPLGTFFFCSEIKSFCDLCGGSGPWINTQAKRKLSVIYCSDLPPKHADAWMQNFIPAYMSGGQTRFHAFTKFLFINDMLEVCKELQKSHWKIHQKQNKENPFSFSSFQHYFSAFRYREIEVTWGGKCSNLE